MKYFIKTFGCQANTADSERLAALLEARGMESVKFIDEADEVYLNTCVVRQSAENRIYGLVHKLGQLKDKAGRPKIIVTGCLVGLALRDQTGKMLRLFKKRLSAADEFMPIDQAGFNYAPLRASETHALVPISSGCSHFCSYCIVPFARGAEVSRPFGEIVDECAELVKKGYQEVTLLGQNVNGYGQGTASTDFLPLINTDKNTHSIPSILPAPPASPAFPELLNKVAKLGFAKVYFISSNPWDFSQELIDVIAVNRNISREIHLPVQSGDDKILQKMRRPYTAQEYLGLIRKIRTKVPAAQFTTDIIVGFPSETEKQFKNTTKLAQKVGFTKAYIAMYSPRPLTLAARLYEDNVPHQEKKKRWRVLEEIINVPEDRISPGI